MHKDGPSLVCLGYLAALQDLNIYVTSLKIPLCHVLPSSFSLLQRLVGGH